MEGTPFGRYRLVEVLGRGGMGEVWRAFDTGTERIVAVKVLPAHVAGDDAFQQRFLREAKAAASLNEPHVVPIYDFGQIDGRLFLAMRLVDGHDLQDLIAHGPLTPDRAVAIIEQIASALDAAHRIGLIHRDVKPSNILVAEDDFAYLIDFGIARVAGETGLTSTGLTLGTWPYMAPERFRTGTVDARADVYALTCVLHQALTGQQPFPGDSLEQIATGHMFDPPPRPSAIRASVPAELDYVIATGMAKDPDERCATPKVLALAARAALSEPTRWANVATRGVTPSKLADSYSAAAPTEAAPTLSAAFAPTQHAPVETPRDRILASKPTRSFHPSEPPRLNRRTVFFAGGSVLLLLIAVIGIGILTSTNDDSRVIYPRSKSPISTSTASALPPTSRTFATTAIPAPDQSWELPAKDIVQRFAGLLPPTPDGTAYNGVVGCQYRPNSPGGEQIACGSSDERLFVSCNKSRATRHPDPLNPQYSSDIHIETWSRGASSGRVRWFTQYGKSGWVQVWFDDADRNFCEISSIGGHSGLGHYEAWFPNAPI
ncbi:serine/threonine-protein kinase [Mycobacterium sp. P7213]|uniref:serine/threonine-protein kinase n=1 Tax=Mycobacterium sp. P7213 TaxID=2478465 RepID=UPI000F63BA70|nr:serine/threonine-protein kinase [Mycobacterium sp. P7213]